MRILPTIGAAALAFFTSTLYAVASPYDGPANTHLRSVDVSGFRLNMTPAAARYQVHILGGRVTDTENALCEAARIHLIQHHRLTADGVVMIAPSGEARCLRNLTVALPNGATTYLTFDEDFRTKPSTLRLVAIAFTFDALTAAERRNAYDAAIRKFGQPTVSFYDGSSGTGEAKWLPYTCGWYDDLDGLGRQNPCLGLNAGWLELSFQPQFGHPAIQLYDGKTDLALLALRKKTENAINANHVTF